MTIGGNVLLVEAESVQSGKDRSGADENLRRVFTRKYALPPDVENVEAKFIGGKLLRITVITFLLEKMIKTNIFSNKFFAIATVFTNRNYSTWSLVFSHFLTFRDRESRGKRRKLTFTMKNTITSQMAVLSQHIKPAHHRPRPFVVTVLAPAVLHNHHRVPQKADERRRCSTYLLYRNWRALTIFY